MMRIIFILFAFMLVGCSEYELSREKGFNSIYDFRAAKSLGMEDSSEYYKHAEAQRLKYEAERAAGNAELIAMEAQKKAEKATIRAQKKAALIAMYAEAETKNPWRLIGAGLYTCEQHDIRNCNRDYQGDVDCIITNTAKVPTDTSSLKAWNYDSRDILVDTSSVYPDFIIPPGKSAHLKMHGVGQSAKSVICSMDPYSPIVMNTFK